MTSEANKGAVSLMSKACAFPLASLTSMKAPPPMPLDAGLTTPKQRAAATAASTAWPPSRRTPTPIREHLPSSVATAPWRATIASLLWSRLVVIGRNSDRKITIRVRHDKIGAAKSSYMLILNSMNKPIPKQPLNLWKGNKRENRNGRKRLPSKLFFFFFPLITYMLASSNSRRRSFLG